MHSKVVIATMIMANNLKGQYSLYAEVYEAKVLEVLCSGWYIFNNEVKALNRSGQTTLQLAKTMEAAALEGASGLQQLVPERTISKYELLKLCNKLLRQDPVEIKLGEGVDEDKSLKRTDFGFDYTIPDYEKWCQNNMIGL